MGSRTATARRSSEPPSSNLADMVTPESHRFIDAGGQATPFAKQVGKNLMLRVRALHRQGTAHGNLKPVMVLVADDGSVTLKGTSIDVEDPNEFSTDVHAVGQILYHCLTSGKYRAAWRYDFKELLGMSMLPVEAHLLCQMLSRYPSERPSIDEALDHIWLWSEQMSCEFTKHLSDYLKDMCKDFSGLPGQFHRCLRDAMQEGAEGWDQKLHPDEALLKVFRKFFKELNTQNWTHLHRCMRNMYRHYREVLKEVPDLEGRLGKASHGAYRYFAAKFPKMLITAYDFVQTYCMEDPTYTWNLPVPVFLPKNGQQSAADLRFVLQSMSAAAGSKEHQAERFVFQLRVDAGSFAPRNNIPQTGEVQQSGSVPCPATSHPSGAQCQALALAGSRSYSAIAASDVQTVPECMDHTAKICMPSYAEAVRIPAGSESIERSNDAISHSIGSCEDMSIDSSSTRASRSTVCGSQNSFHAHCASSQHAHHVRGRPKNVCQRPAIAAESKNLEALKATAYNQQGRKAAIWRFENLADQHTAYEAACIGRCYEEGSAGFKNVSCALDWYYKACALEDREPIKQYISSRIAELQHKQRVGL